MFFNVSSTILCESCSTCWFLITDCGISWISWLNNGCVGYDGGSVVGRYGGRGHGLCTLFDGGSIISGLFRRTGITFDGNSPFTLPAGQKLATTNVL